MRAEDYCPFIEVHDLCPDKRLCDGYGTMYNNGIKIPCKMHGTGPTTPNHLERKSMEKKL